MPALRRASIVALLAVAQLATGVGMPAALAQSERSGQWTDPPQRAGAPSAGADQGGSREPPAASPREAGRRGATASKARPAASAARLGKRRAAMAGRAIRSASIRRARQARVAVLHRRRVARAAHFRRSAALRQSRAAWKRSLIARGPARYRQVRAQPARVGAIGAAPDAAQPEHHDEVVRRRPEDDPGPLDLFDPDLSGFDWFD